MPTASGCKKEGNEQPCPGPEVSYVANAAEGEYYARKFSKGDEYCYCVRVTAVGYDAWGLVDAWNENLSMLLYSAESYSGKGDIKIPAGTYRIGAAGETEAGTVSRDESYFRTVESDGDNSTSYYFEEGEVTVSYSGEDIVISGSFVDKSCVVRRFSYEGPCYVWNYAPDQNIEASYFYCDKKGSSDNSLYEYAIVLSDLGYDENGYMQPKGVYYEFRVFLPELFDTVFPAGTYPMGEDAGDKIRVFNMLSSLQTIGLQVIFLAFYKKGFSYKKAEAGEKTVRNYRDLFCKICLIAFCAKLVYNQEHII